MQSITLQTSDSIITSGDFLGRLGFAASSELDGADALLVAATVEAIAEGNFTQTSNSTSLVFSTADSETALPKLKITSGGHFIPLASGTYDLGSPSFPFRNLYVDGGYVTAPTGVFDVISFNVDNESILTKGQISWDDTEGTMDIGLTDNTTIHIGEHRYFRIKNETGDVLYKGQVIYATGVHSNGLITPAKYVADGSVREVRFIGVVLEDVNNNNNGYAIDFGHLEEIDLDGSVSNYSVGDETWVAGDILYVHPAVAGKLTKVEPKHSISVAIVLDPGNGNGNGRMFVRPISYGHINDNHDVDTSGALNGQMLRYISSSDVWTTGIIYDDGTSVSINGTSAGNQLHVSSSNDRSYAYILASGGIGTESSLTRINNSNNSTSDSFAGLFLTTTRAGSSVSQGAIIANVATNASTYQPNIVFAARNGGSNYAELMRIDYAGNLGIGTNAPSSKLDVSGVVTASGGNSNNWNSAYSWGDHSQSDYLTSISGQNIQDLANVESSLSYPLLVDEYTLIYDSDINKFKGTRINLGLIRQGTIPLAGYDSSYLGYYLRMNTNELTVNEQGTNLNFRVEGNGVQSLLFTDAISNSVGIGTSQPAANLHIARPTDATYGNIFIEDTTDMNINVGGSIIFGGRHTTAGATARFGGIRGLKANNTDGDYSSVLSLLYNNGTSLVEGFRITPQGNIGIGGIAPPISHKFSIRGNLDANNAIGLMVNPAYGSAATSGNLYNYYSWGSLNGYTVQNYYHYFTAAPALTNGAVINNELCYTASNSAAVLSQRGFYSTINGTSSWQLYMGGTARSFINGNLGIGNSNPTSKLSVENGSVVFNALAGNHDFTVGGDTDVHTLCVDASADSVGIGIATPLSTLHIEKNTIPSIRIQRSASVGTSSVPAERGHILFSNYNNTYDHIKLISWGRESNFLAGMLGINISNSAGVSSEVLTIDNQSTASTFGLRTYNIPLVTTSGNAIFNETAGDYDFRVEGVSDQNLLFVDASADRVGIGTANPTVKLDVNGTFRANDVVTLGSGSIPLPRKPIELLNPTNIAELTINDSYTFPTNDGTSGQALLTDGSGSISWTNITLNQTVNGRLTLESGVPISTTDQTAKTTLYFTPYLGNQIALYNGTEWKIYSFSELSLSLSGYTANTNYDIFVYDNSGTLTLESTAWTDGTTRATALVLQDGVYVKSGATTRRYLGTIRITGTTGQCEDSLNRRFVWNLYNQTDKLLTLLTSATHTYATATWRPWNNNTTIGYARHDFIIGLSNVIDIRTAGIVTQAYIAGALDMTNLWTSRWVGISTLSSVGTEGSRQVLADSGYHFVQGIQYGLSASSTYMELLMTTTFRG